MSHRTFLALDVDEPTRRRLAEWAETLRRATGRTDGIRWVAPENYHLTLKFLGDVEDAQLADVCRTVQALAAKIPPFAFEVRGLRAVPPVGRNLRLLWAEIGQGQPHLADLFRRVENAMEPLGFARECRPFAQHITLARVTFVRTVEALRAAAEQLAEASAGMVSADHVTVYLSRLGKGGPTYTPALQAAMGKSG